MSIDFAVCLQSAKHYVFFFIFADYFKADFFVHPYGIVRLLHGKRCTGIARLSQPDEHFPHHLGSDAAASVFLIQGYRKGGSVVVYVTVIVHYARPYRADYLSVGNGGKCHIPCPAAESFGIDLQFGLVYDIPRRRLCPLGDKYSLIEKIAQQRVLVGGKSSYRISRNIISFL